MQAFADSPPSRPVLVPLRPVRGAGGLDIFGSGGDMTPDFEHIIEELASRLYCKLETLAPGVDDFVPWVNLPDADKGVYRFAIEDLSRYGDEWRSLDRLASDG